MHKYLWVTWFLVLAACGEEHSAADALKEDAAATVGDSDASSAGPMAEAAGKSGASDPMKPGAAPRDDEDAGKPNGPGPGGTDDDKGDKPKRDDGMPPKKPKGMKPPPPPHDGPMMKKKPKPPHEKPGDRDAAMPEP